MGPPDWWRRFFGNPPTLREVTDLDARISPPKRIAPESYQVNRAPTKSLSPPRFVAARWAEADALPCVASDGTVTLALAHPPPSVAMRLGPFSPVVDRRPRPADPVESAAIGRLSAEGEGWTLESGGLRVNGRRTATPHRTPLAHGDVLEFIGASQSWTSVVAFDEQPTLDTQLGPLWWAFDCGALTLARAPGESRWAATLRSTVEYPARGSLEWLHALSASDFAPRVASLDLHLWFRTPKWTWEAYVARHLELELPFELRLFAPTEVVGTTRLPGVVVPTSSVSLTPWLARADGTQAAMTASRSGWTAPVDDLVLRCIAEPEGVLLLDENERPGPLVRWFERRDRGVFFLPRPSRFLAERLRPASLEVDDVRHFVVTLEASGDACAEGLRALLEDRDDAASWLGRLLCPWATGTPWLGSIDVASAEHRFGFLTSLRVKPWCDLEEDIESLLDHPLLAFLRQLEITAPVVETVTARIRALRPDLVVWRQRGLLRVNT